MKKVVLLTCSIVAFVGCGKSRHHHHDRVTVYHSKPAYRAKTVEVTHVCSRSCHHHYHNGKRVVVLKGHRHGPRCGHHWNGKHWVVRVSHDHDDRKIVIKKKSPKRKVHVCSRSCHHHYHNGKKLVVLKNHRHHKGCGHRWNGKVWIRVK